MQVNYVNWAVINLCYYGLTMNSVNLNGNIFINSLLGVLIEAPGRNNDVMGLIDKAGL